MNKTELYWNNELIDEFEDNSTIKQHIQEAERLRYEYSIAFNCEIHEIIALTNTHD